MNIYNEYFTNHWQIRIENYKSIEFVYICSKSIPNIHVNTNNNEDG